MVLCLTEDSAILSLVTATENADTTVMERKCVITEADITEAMAAMADTVMAMAMVTVMVTVIQKIHLRNRHLRKIKKRSRVEKW